MMKIRLLVLAFGTLIPMVAVANALLQPTPCTISKTYSNGDRVMMECDAQRRAQCRITVRVDGETTKVPVPLEVLGLEPGMERIQLFPVSKHEFSLALDVACPDEDEEHLPPQTQMAECIFRFSVVDGIPERAGSLQVLAIENASAYRALDIPPGPISH